jgi:signal peptidase I
MFKNFISFLFELVKLAVICAAIVIPIRYFLIQPFYVQGASMEPTFHTHEYLIVDEISYRFSEPKRGDVIVFRYPVNPQEHFIKRIVGLPGETVEIKDGKVYIYNDKHPDGALVEEEYLDSSIETHGFSKQKEELEENEYFVLGDNRNSSKDSRNFGPVKESFIVGQVFFRGWPFNKAGFFEDPEYGL